MVSPHVPMIAHATGRAPLLAVRNRTRGIRSLFIIAEKKQKTTLDRAVKHKYPLEIIRKQNRGNSLVKMVTALFPAMCTPRYCAWTLHKRLTWARITL